VKWAIVYDSAEHDDGTFPFEKIGLDKEFLDHAKRTMGPYMYANQYLNETIPEGLQIFKREWFQYYHELPKILMTFAFIDPAIGMDDDNDFTATVVVSISTEMDWYVRLAKRDRMTPTEIVNSMFELQKQYKCDVMGIEDVAYQKALLYLLDEEMRRRELAGHSDAILPVFGIRPGNDETKAMRIKALVPRYYWRRVFHKPGLDDLEKEMLQFPRGKHDDIIDALAYIDRMASEPTAEAQHEEDPEHTSDKAFIQRLVKSKKKSR
jgi:predicted phage terminase large subunit-like protein